MKEHENILIEFRELQEKWPLSDQLSHIKRIRKLPSGELEVVLSLKTTWASIEASMNDFLQRYELTRTETIVPRFPPIKKEQLPEWSAVWPVSFHRQEPYEEEDIFFLY